MTYVRQVQRRLSAIGLTPTAWGGRTGAASVALAGIALGLGAGVAVGLLAAPFSGSEDRRRIAARARELTRRARPALPGAPSRAERTHEPSGADLLGAPPDYAGEQLRAR